MTAPELISILQMQDLAAVAVLSMCPGEDVGDKCAVAVERVDISAVQLRAIDDGEYRKRHEVVLEDGIPGVWLG